MCTRDFFGAEVFCALYFLVGKFGGEEVGEKWGVWYHTYFSFLSLITNYLVKWCGVPEVVVLKGGGNVLYF